MKKFAYTFGVGALAAAVVLVIAGRTPVRKVFGL
jgi:hypothetical protein